MNFSYESPDGLAAEKPLWKNRNPMIVIIALSLALIGAIGHTTDLDGQPLVVPTPVVDRAAAYSLFLQALMLEDNGDLVAAIRTLQEASDFDPASAEIHAVLAELYARQNRVDEAVASAQRALELKSDNIHAHRILGLLFITIADQQSERDSSERENYVDRAIRHLERVQSERLYDEQVMFSLGRLYVEKNFFDKGVKALSQVVERSPGFSEAARLLAHAYASLGHREQAVQVLETVVRQRTPSTQTVNALVLAYEDNGQWKQAAQLYQRLARRRPKDSRVTRRWAMALLNAGSTLRAREVIGRIADLTSTDAAALYLLAEAERRLNNFDKAEEAARRLIAVESEEFRGSYLLSQILFQQGRYEDAVRAIEPAIDQARVKTGVPGLARLLVQAGQSYRVLNRQDDAINVFVEASRLARRNVRFTEYAVEAYLEANRPEEALAFIRAVRTEQPNELRLVVLAARSLIANNQITQGILTMQSYISKYEADPSSQVALANIFVDAGRINEAVKTLQTANKKFPSETSILFQLAAILEEQSRFSDAERVFREVLSRNPAHHQTLNYLGYMLADRGERLQESVELIKRALDVDPNNGSYLDSLGWAYFKLRDFDLAENYLRKASEQLIYNSVIQDHFGDVLFEQLRYEEAIEAWERALRGDAESIEPSVIAQKISETRKRMSR